VAVSCEHSNEASGSIKGGDLLDWLRDIASQDGLLHGVCC
jgi:hypothetical protein